MILRKSIKSVKFLRPELDSKLNEVLLRANYTDVAANTASEKAALVASVKLVEDVIAGLGAGVVIDDNSLDTTNAWSGSKIDQVISNAIALKDEVIVVDTENDLPATGDANGGFAYVITDSTSNNNMTLYYWRDSEGQWLKGSVLGSLDLSDYVTTTGLDAAILVVSNRVDGISIMNNNGVTLTGDGTGDMTFITSNDVAGELVGGRALVFTASGIFEIDAVKNGSDKDFKLVFEAGDTPADFAGATIRATYIPKV